MKSFAFLLASTAVAMSAQAATVSFNFTNPLETTEITQSGQLGLFDSSLGTLTGATLNFIGQNTTLITLTNTAAQAQRVTATGTTELFFGSSLASLDALIAASNPVITLSVTTGSQQLATGATVSFGPLLGSSTITWTNELAGVLADLSVAGGGSFLLGCESSSGLGVVGGGGNVSSSQKTEAGCGASITYTYEPTRNDVPEPSALALVGLALAGLALSRRKA